jgi:putative FmdB family regulatory protein
MPTYEYKCDSCHHTFEVFQSIKAEPLTKCPNCGKSKLKKLISSGAGLIFKGSGFYLTDYKNKHSQTKKSSGKVIDTTKESATKDTPKPAEKKASNGKTSKK